MSPVPSTPTFADSQAEHKALRLEINALKAEKETAKRELVPYTETMTALRKELSKHLDVSVLKDAVLENVRAKARQSLEDTEKKENVLRNQAHLHLSLVKTAQEGLKASQNASDELQQALDANHLKLQKETDDLNAFRMNKEREMAALAQSLSDIREELNSSRADLKNYQEEYKTKHDFVVAEEQRLAIRSSDLAVYEERLRKKCLELYPEMEIIL